MNHGARWRRVRRVGAAYLCGRAGRWWTSSCCSHGGRAGPLWCPHWPTGLLLLLAAVADHDGFMGHQPWLAWPRARRLLLLLVHSDDHAGGLQRLWWRRGGGDWVRSCCCRRWRLLLIAWHVGRGRGRVQEARGGRHGHLHLRHRRLRRGRQEDGGGLEVLFEGGGAGERRVAGGQLLQAAHG